VANSKIKLHTENYCLFLYGRPMLLSVTRHQLIHVVPLVGLQSNLAMPKRKTSRLIDWETFACKGVGWKISRVGGNGKKTEK